MAKREKSRRSEGTNGEIDPAMFLQPQGDQTAQLGLLLKLLGMGDEQGLEREKLGMSREELEERLGLSRSAQDLEERKFTAEEKRAGETEAFRNWEKQQAITRANEERDYKRQQLASEEQKSKDATNREILQYVTDPAERKALINEMSSEAQRMDLKMETAKQNAAVKNLVPAVEAAYKKGDWDTIKQITGTLSPETVARPEFEWQKWNQAAPAPRVGLIEQAKTMLRPEAPVRSEAPLAWMVDAIQERGSRPVSFIKHDAPPGYEPNAGVPRQMNVDQVLGMLGNPAPTPAPVAQPGLNADDLLRMIQEERERNLSATRMGP